ncbi:MAG: GntP family permease [Cyclobacteriaceae bacterium]|nr:GntP family permease [Cyclobacteriaceae bacterium]
MSPLYLLLILLVAILWMIAAGSYLKWHPFFSLLSATFGFGLLAALPPALLLDTMLQGFGALIGSIGLIVILGCILGVLLEDSGSVQQLGGALALRATRYPSLALAFLGLLLGIPVFCDSGFIILFSLTKSMAVASGTPVPIMSLSLAGGLYSSHTLVPPTPGPVAAAATLGGTGSIGLVMLLGILVSIPVTLAAHLYARFAGQKLKLGDSLNRIEKAISGPATAWQAVFLILFPVALIAAGSTVVLLQWDDPFSNTLSFLGKPVVALLMAVVLAMILFRRHGSLTSSIDKGLRQAGPIILLTGCGGGFGAVLKASPLANGLAGLIHEQGLTGVGFLTGAFLLGVAFKTAQGSTTSAMILVSALLSPLLSVSGLDSSSGHALLVLTIGAGSMMVSHANDSYFWVVSQFNGFTLREGYLGITLMTLVQGLTAFISVVILFLLIR